MGSQLFTNCNQIVVRKHNGLLETGGSTGKNDGGTGVARVFTIKYVCFRFDATRLDQVIRKLMS